MGRNRVRFDRMNSGYGGGPRWNDPFHCEWGTVVGDRIRRLRRERGMTLRDLCLEVDKPQGGLRVEPGRLLGPDDAQRQVSEAEITLLHVLRRMEMAPADAIGLLAGLG
jgi:hypothetical protein